jgi:hypothetical protein
MERSKNPFAVLLLGLMLGMGACGGSSGPPVPEPPPPIPPGEVNQARLDRVAGCDELLDSLRQDGQAKVRDQAEGLRQDGWGDEGDFFVGAPVPAAPEEGSDRSPENFSDTNVQVAGVDEADFVETDGEHIYLLDWDRLVVLDSWPPSETAVEAVLALEGHARAMFVDRGRAVVFSEVFDDQGRFGAARDCAFAEPVMFDRALVADVAPCPVVLTKVTVVDLSGAPIVERELYVEGTYAAARRHDTVVRTVVRGGALVPTAVPDFWGETIGGAYPEDRESFLGLVDDWEREALEAMEQAGIEDWLPGLWEVRGGSLEAIPPLCSGVQLPAPGQAGQGSTRIVGLDMGVTSGEFYDTLILGRASEVYASADRLVLAQPQWDWGPDGDRTALHLFSVGSQTLETGYLASGFVPGQPLNQFSFDFWEGVLRVATTQFGDFEGGQTRSQIVTARVVGDRLETLGSTGGLAPGERIYSARFVGDRGYLVTFRQIDPLFVVDLSDPSRPAVLGELKLPGFSEYMQPIGPGHLLTIGQEADLEGRVTGLALRIFDVSEDRDPKLAHLWLFEEQGWSSATSDQLNFVYEPSRGLLAFPYVSYGEEFRSVLQLFAVDVSRGFEQLGEIEHGALLSEQCGTPENWACSYTPEVRRGLFIEDHVYSISAAGVLVHAVADLENEVARVPLPDVAPGETGS